MGVDDETVTITSGPIGRGARLIIGDQVVPVREMDIRIRCDELVMVTAVLPASYINVEALESQTHIIIERDGSDANHDS